MKKQKSNAEIISGIKDIIRQAKTLKELIAMPEVMVIAKNEDEVQGEVVDVQVVFEVESFDGEGLAYAEDGNDKHGDGEVR